ncbi:hypothetical protein [Dyella sp.]|nr:hypothetical protein [Dyella sp.]HET7329335.1 hypothetical protein [Dyella sp.]
MVSLIACGGVAGVSAVTSAPTTMIAATFVHPGVMHTVGNIQE